MRCLLAHHWLKQELLFARAHGILLLHLGEGDIWRSSASILEILAIFRVALLSRALSRPIIAQAIEILSIR